MKNFIVLFLILFLSVYHLIPAEYQVHQLKEGETLWRISKIYNVALDDLCRINKISDVTKVKQGAIVKIPLNNGVKSNINNDVEICYKLHVLKKTETLWRISKTYSVSIDEICRINGISDIKKVQTGKILKIPVKVKYFNYNLPLEGKVIKFNTSHFEGVNIITDNNEKNRIVYAIDNGEITYIDKIPGYGLTIFIRHPNGLISTYSSFEEIYVTKNIKIQKGQKIGLAGNLVRQSEYGIIFSLQEKGNYLKFDFKKKMFFKK